MEVHSSPVKLHRKALDRLGGKRQRGRKKERTKERKKKENKKERKKEKEEFLCSVKKKLCCLFELVFLCTLADHMLLFLVLFFYLYLCSGLYEIYAHFAYCC